MSFPYNNSFAVTSNGNSACISARRCDTSQLNLKSDGARPIYSNKHQNGTSDASISSLTVDHAYRDFAGVPPTLEDRERYSNKEREYARMLNNPENCYEQEGQNGQDYKRGPGRGNRETKGPNRFLRFMGTNFPARLHDLLSHDQEELSNVITWLPHGRSWIVLDRKAFLKVASSHFHMSKFESFIRQVNGWGFKRITQGPDINSYYHELFLQGMPHLIQFMKRSTSSRPGRRKVRSDPSDEPNLHAISKLYPIPDYYAASKNDDVDPEILGDSKAAVTQHLQVNVLQLKSSNRCGITSKESPSSKEPKVEEEKKPREPSDDSPTSQTLVQSTAKQMNFSQKDTKIAPFSPDRKDYNMSLPTSIIEHEEAFSNKYGQGDFMTSWNSKSFSESSDPNQGQSPIMVSVFQDNCHPLSCSDEVMNPNAVVHAHAEVPFGDLDNFQLDYDLNFVQT